MQSKVAAPTPELGRSVASNPSSRRTAAPPLNSSVRPMSLQRRELSKEEYEATFSPPMLNVTESAEELVDLWDYAAPIVDTDYPNAGDWNWRAMFIYESRDGLYQHLNIPVPEDNKYLSVVVAKEQAEILGHYYLDLKALYPDWNGGA